MPNTVNIWGNQRSVPLTVYLAAHDTTALRPAMLICPGGAYREHAEHEGRDYALWLSQHGVHCFVLAYRLGSLGHAYPAPFEDVTRAMQFIRHHASTWGVDATRVGIMGSSAGGHLASMLLTHFDRGNFDSSEPLERQSSRPELGILCYPVISMQVDPHLVSRANLLGALPEPKLVQFVSSETQVTAATPPCFIWHTSADPSVKVSHSLAFASALQRANVPFELHVYQTGGHGLGLVTSNPWAQDCLAWLKVQGFCS